MRQILNAQRVQICTWNTSGNAWIKLYISFWLSSPAQYLKTRKWKAYNTQKKINISNSRKQHNQDMDKAVDHYSRISMSIILMMGREEDHCQFFLRLSCSANSTQRWFHWSVSRSIWKELIIALPCRVESLHAEAMVKRYVLNWGVWSAILHWGLLTLHQCIRDKGGATQKQQPFEKMALKNG